MSYAHSIVLGQRYPWKGCHRGRKLLSARAQGERRSTTCHVVDKTAPVQQGVHSHPSISYFSEVTRASPTLAYKATRLLEVQRAVGERSPGWLVYLPTHTNT